MPFWTQVSSEQSLPSLDMSQAANVAKSVLQTVL